MPVPTGPLPSSLLLWNADELRDPPAAPCCLRTTCAGSRAAVYCTGSDGGVALVDFTTDATARRDGSWAAEGVAHVFDSAVPRPVLLADDLLGPVFRHLRGRRGLPEPAARRLLRLLSREAVR